MELRRRAGPGGILGGMMWGSASNNDVVIATNQNSMKFKLALRGADSYLRAVPNEPGSSVPPVSADGGMAVALSAFDGTIRWTFTNPEIGVNNLNKAGIANPPTIANGVVLVASTDAQGHLFALRASDGALLGKYPTGSSSISGPAVVDGSIYMGSGYSTFGQGIDGTRVVAFKAPPPPPKPRG